MAEESLSMEDLNLSSDDGVSKEETANDAIGQTLERDAKIRTEIADIYKSLIDLFNLETFEKNFGSVIMKDFYGGVAKIKCNMELLQRKHCPIVVAGETSAGKSSLLNLLLGEHLLPDHMLSCTSTICQIYNSVEKKAVAIDENGTKTFIKDLTKETLSGYVQIDRSKKCTHRYKTVEIYWPVPMLKNHATLVDTPGVGESNELTRKLTEYMSEAIAFIYVINTPNAGGVQKDRLLQIFEKQREMDQNGDFIQFDPECTIFVCNKWDLVKEKDEEDVWKHIAKTLLKFWPTNSNTDITKQMFKLSVGNDLHSSKGFKSLVFKINQLISVCLERRVVKHVQWLQRFLNRLLMIVIAKTNASRKNQEEKKALKLEIEQRLKTLEIKTHEVKEYMKMEAEMKCVNIAADLSVHLHSEETKQKVLTWNEDEFPDDNRIHYIHSKATKRIVDKINDQIMQWCQDKNISRISTELFEIFIERCKLIEVDVREKNQVLQQIQPPITDRNLKSLEESSSDSSDLGLGLMLTLKQKIVIAVSAPVWIPLAIVSGVLVLPVAMGILYASERIDEKKEIDEYRNNKEAYISQLFDTEIKNYDRCALYNSILKTYIRDFMSTLKQFCENNIPKQITADQELIENIVKEDRDSQILKEEYAPIERKCKEIIGKLIHVNMKYLPDIHFSILREHKVLGQGSFASVLICDVEIAGTKLQSAIKRLMLSMKTNPYIALMEVEQTRNFNHSNVVKCYGISIEETDEQKEFLNIFTEVCECSLADVIFCDNHITEMCQCNFHRRETCHRYEEKCRVGLKYEEAWNFFTTMLDDILNGLVYLHDKLIVHRNLKLSNILILKGRAKLVDIGLSRPHNLQDTMTGTPVFLAPEVLQGLIYDSAADIYSLAIIMWEMWYGREIASDVFNTVKEHTFFTTCPKLKKASPPPKVIQKMIENCCIEEAEKRPTAKKLKIELTKIVQKAKN